MIERLLLIKDSQEQERLWDFYGKNATLTGWVTKMPSPEFLKIIFR